MRPISTLVCDRPISPDAVLRSASPVQSGVLAIHATIVAFLLEKEPLEMKLALSLPFLLPVGVNSSLKLFVRSS